MFENSTNRKIGKTINNIDWWARKRWARRRFFIIIENLTFGNKRKNVTPKSKRLSSNIGHIRMGGRFMSLNTIGILGCGGHIGKYANWKVAKIWVFKFWVHKEISVTYFDDYKNYSFTNIDVMDKGQLDGFVEKCDIVINCISPSHLYGENR